MNLAVGNIIVTSMKYKVGDIVLVKSSAGPAIPNIHVKLLQKIKRNTSFDLFQSDCFRTFLDIRSTHSILWENISGFALKILFKAGL